MKNKKVKIITAAIIIALAGSGFAYKSLNSRIKYQTKPLENVQLHRLLKLQELSILLIQFR